MRRPLLPVGIACVFLLGTVRHAPAQAPKPQALIITGQNGHDLRATTPVLRKFLEDTKRCEVRVTEEFQGAGLETLAPYDPVILNYYDANKPAQRCGARADAALLEFVRGGKGLVVYHFSERHRFTVTLKDRDHPIMRGIRAAFPQENDELYANLKWQPEGAFHVLATAYDDHSLYKAGEKRPLPGAGLNQPTLWITNFGDGRVFTTALGHDPEAMKMAGFIATFVRGAEWAATGSVTIPVPGELQ